MIATHQVTHLLKPCSPSCSAHQNAIVTSQPIRHKAKPLLGEATKGTGPDQRCLKDKYGTRKRIVTLANIIILRPGTGDHLLTSWTKKASQTIFQKEKERCLQYQYSLDSRQFRLRYI